MEKTVAGQAAIALFIFLLPLIPGCVQSGGRVAPEQPLILSSRNADFNMGGVNLKLPLPRGWAEASPPVRRAAALAFTPPEQIFGVYTPAEDRAKADASGPDGAGLELLRNRRLLIISARPEFMREIVDPGFYRAMQRDLTRVNGVFSPERLERFKALTETHYANDDAFAHSLGVYARAPASLAVVRVVRQAASRGAGATTVYPDAASAVEAAAGESGPVWRGWDRDYFARAYYQVSVQNVLLLNGRCFNVHFFAPLAGEGDVYAAMRQNKEYLDALAAALAGRNAVHPEPLPAGGQESAAVRRTTGG